MSEMRSYIVQVGKIFDAHELRCAMVCDLTPVPRLQDEAGVERPPTILITRPIIRSACWRGLVRLFLRKKFRTLLEPVERGAHDSKPNKPD